MLALKIALIAVLGLAIHFGLAYAIVKFLDWRRDRRDRTRLRREVVGRRERLRQPHFDEIEKLLGRPVPEFARRVWTDNPNLSEEDVLLIGSGPEPLYLGYFIPATMQDFADCGFPIPGLTKGNYLPARGNTAAKTILPIACDGFGDLYYLPLDTHSRPDTRLHLWHHDGGDDEELPFTIGQFLSFRFEPRAAGRWPT